MLEALDDIAEDEEDASLHPTAAAGHVPYSWLEPQTAAAAYLSGSLGAGAHRVAPLTGPALLRHHDAVLGSLRPGGFSVALAAHAFSVIDAYVHGFVLTESNLPFEDAEQVGEVAADILSGMPDDTDPYLTELITEHALTPGYDYGEEYGFGLDLVPDGLGDRLRGARSPNRTPSPRPRDVRKTA